MDPLTLCVSGRKLAAQRKRAVALRAEAGRQRKRAERQIQHCEELQQRWSRRVGVEQPAAPGRHIRDENRACGTIPAHAVVAFGASAGGCVPLSVILAHLPRSLGAAVIVAQHSRSSSVLAMVLRRSCELPIRIARHGECLRDDCVYIPPTGFHIAIAIDKTIALTPRSAPPCPSVDGLFGSLALSYGKHVIAVVLSGFLNDGAIGISRLSTGGADVIVQEPATCATSGMPDAALRTGRVNLVLAPARIADAIVFTLNAQDVGSRV
jgi:chemotaxis response regulator CheB